MGLPPLSTKSISAAKALSSSPLLRPGSLCFMTAGALTWYWGPDTCLVENRHQVTAWTRWTKKRQPVWSIDRDLLGGGSLP